MYCSFYIDPWVKFLYGHNINNTCSSPGHCSVFNIWACVTDPFSWAARELRAKWPTRSKSVCPYGIRSYPQSWLYFLSLQPFFVFIIYAFSFYVNCLIYLEEIQAEI